MTADLLTKGLTAPTEATPATVVKLAPEGIVVAIVAVTGVVDAVEDLIVPGAFAHTLTVRRPKVVFQHQWTEQVGRVLHVEEWMPGDPRLPKQTKDGKPWPAAAGALVATMQFNMRSPRAAEQWEMVRFYAETNEAEFSIGYKVPDGKARKRRDGVRVILQVDLYEFSHVLFGAAPLSMALDVKSAGMHSASAGTTTRATLGTNTDEPWFDHEAPRVDATKSWDDDETDEDDEPTDADRAPLELKTATALVADLGIHTITATIEEKSMTYMAGSFEDRTERIREAAKDLFCKDDRDDEHGHTWVCIRATFDTEVIVTVEKEARETSYLVPYAYDGETVELGEAKEVELNLVAAPAGADAEPATEDEDAVATALAGQIMSGLMQVKTLARIAGVTSEELRTEAANLLVDLGGKSAPQPEDEVEVEEEPGDEPAVTETDMASQAEAGEATGDAAAPGVPAEDADPVTAAIAAIPEDEPEEAEEEAVDAAPVPLADPPPPAGAGDVPVEDEETKGGPAAPVEDEDAPEGHEFVEPFDFGDDEAARKGAPAPAEEQVPEETESEVATDVDAAPAPAPEAAENAGERVELDPDEHLANLESLGIYDDEDEPKDDDED